MNLEWLFNMFFIPMVFLALFGITVNFIPNDKIKETNEHSVEP